MKHAYILGFLVFLNLSSHAQSGELTNAILAHKDGMLSEAKISIDKASVHEKTINEPKTWYNKGKIYESIALDPTLSKENPTAAKTAVESYLKAKELDVTAAKPGKFKKDIEEAMTSQNLAVAVQNGGITAYQKKDYDVAYNYFTLYQNLRPTDTLGYLYAAQMALAKNDYKNAKEAYVKGFEKTGYTSPEVLTNLLYIYTSVDTEKDENKALEIVKLGKSKYPENQTFIKQEVNLLEKTGKLPEAIANLEGIISKGDTKLENYLLLGSLYENNKQFDKAKEAYNKALAINPNSFEANYNMGALIFNPAIETIRSVRNMSLSDTKKKGEKMEAQAKEVIKTALPYFEKAYQVKNTDSNTRRTLKEVYAVLGMKEKAENLK